MGCGFSLPQVVAAVRQIQEKVQQEQEAQASPTSPVAATVYGRQSPVYETLPQGATQYQVRNVYDGDTLTLVDERRVRFLGVDTPELKEQQPFAQEAKDYTKIQCHNKEIYLVTEGEDHYGRLLGWIYVTESNGHGYLCVNEGLIQQGLAYAYTPKKDDQPFNWHKLLELQSEARTAKRGVWASFKDETVVATANGSAYHIRSCKHLSDIRNLTEMTISQATDKGLHPCRTCLG
jgi:micrococcal nuclease